MVFRLAAKCVLWSQPVVEYGKILANMLTVLGNFFHFTLQP